MKTDRQIPESVTRSCLCNEQPAVTGETSGSNHMILGYDFIRSISSHVINDSVFVYVYVRARERARNARIQLKYVIFLT